MERNFEGREARASNEERKVVFVYGTLLGGEANHHVLGRALRIGEARTAARFELFDLGPYPGLVGGRHQSITGEIYEVDEDTLAALDESEGHPEFYRRERILLQSGQEAQCYLLPAAQVKGRPRITSGSWRARREKRSA